MEDPIATSYQFHQTDHVHHILTEPRALHDPSTECRPPTFAQSATNRPTCSCARDARAAPTALLDRVPEEGLALAQAPLRRHHPAASPTVRKPRPRHLFPSRSCGPPARLGALSPRPRPKECRHHPRHREPRGPSRARGRPGGRRKRISRRPRRH